jgi:YHS domain-containing protein
MLRFVVLLFGIVIAITVLRMVIGIVMKSAGSLLGGAEKKPVGGPEVPIRGELKRDPVCGTYVSTATALTRTVGGETHYFCSQECRSKHLAG